MLVQANQDRNKDRIKSIIGVAVFHALVGYAFITGLGFEVATEVSEQLKMFDVTEELPPPPVELPPAEVEQSDKQQTKDPEGAAAPPNLKDTPTQIVAPPPEVKLPIPPPIRAAPAAGQGNAEAAGAAQIPGPGTGAGGVGNGLGSGLFGSGTGGGGGGRPIRAQHIRGGIYDRDYPRRVFEAGIGGTVYLRFVVAPNGRVSECRVTRSSGNRELDATTCNLIQRRFRYRPARDAGGNPIAETIVGQHEWEAQVRRGPMIEIEEPAEE